MDIVEIRNIKKMCTEVFSISYSKL